MTHNLNLNLHNQKEKAKYYSNTDSIKVWNTNERDLTPTQNTKKVDQRKNNHEKTKVAKNQKNTCLKDNHNLRGKSHLTKKQPHTRSHANEEPQNSEQKRLKLQKINSTHLYQGKHEKNKNNLRNGKCKPTAEKPELKFETKNNLPSPQNIHEGKTISKSGVVNMAN